MKTAKSFHFKFPLNPSSHSESERRFCVVCSCQHDTKKFSGKYQVTGFNKDDIAEFFHLESIKEGKVCNRKYMQFYRSKASTKEKANHSLADEIYPKEEILPLLLLISAGRDIEKKAAQACAQQADQTEFSKISPISVHPQHL